MYLLMHVHQINQTVEVTIPTTRTKFPRVELGLEHLGLFLPSPGIDLIRNNTAASSDSTGYEWAGEIEYRKLRSVRTTSDGRQIVRSNPEVYRDTFKLYFTPKDIIDQEKRAGQPHTRLRLHYQAERIELQESCPVSTI